LKHELTQIDDSGAATIGSDYKTIQGERMLPIQYAPELANGQTVGSMVEVKLRSVRRVASSIVLSLAAMLASPVLAQGAIEGTGETKPVCKTPSDAKELVAFRKCIALQTPDAVSLAFVQGQRPVARDAISTLGPDLFGDRVNLFNGSFEFEHTDVLLPGNNALHVAFVRRHTPGRNVRIRGAMADWDLNTPRIEGTFATAEGWVPSYGSAATRCSGFEAPPTVQRQYLPNPRFFLDVSPWEYWSGTNLVVPGSGSQEILRRATGNTLLPSDGANYPLVTRNQWQIGCLPSIQNGVGQGFFALSPEGVRYEFDWMASRKVPELRKYTALYRSEFFLMASRVSDRFGNWVRYTYDSANPINLQRIESNDGRLITVSYTANRVSSVNDGIRTWQYLYSAAGGDLQFVLQPDGSRWQFDLRTMVNQNPEIPDQYVDCDTMAPQLSGEFPGTITHPSGAVGRFTTAFVVHGRTNVDRACTYIPDSNWTDGAVWPKSTANQALVSKQITGPGMEPMTWRYSSGGDPFGEWAPCTGCQDTKIVGVTEPSGVITAYTFGVMWRVNEGQLLKVEENWNPNSGVGEKVTAYNYRNSVGQNFPERYGDSVNLTGDYLSTTNRPQDKRVVSLQGIGFTWQADPTAAGFDGFARPVKVNTFSGLGYARTQLTDYHDNFGIWVLGQTGRVTELTTGKVVEAHGFHPTTALKTASQSFGRFTNAFDYNSDGTLAALYDAAYRPTVFQNFWRGLPQRAVFPDYSVASHVVNNLGNVASITNEVYTTTSFGFDTMGRVAQINYPTGDPVAYLPTTQGFVQSDYAEWGLPAGHWRQTISTGNSITTRWFDALWRVRLERRMDAADPWDTPTYVETRYDAAGRKSFESYPARSFSSLNNTIPGKTTLYDSLNRVIRNYADSELGVLPTYTEYLNGFQRRVTNPRGQATTFGYQAFDTPSEDAITSISAPENVSVTIKRDVFGKPEFITRSGYGAGVYSSATRSYVYDQHQRLCKTIEPETGATIQDYDQAGNLAWRASGLGLSNPNDCDTYSVPYGQKIIFGYDPRNRLTSTTYGDGSPSITKRYTRDGLLEYSESGGWSWNYYYNNRRLLTTEQYNFAGGNYPTTRRYNAYGHEDLLAYWGNIASVDHAPNALGQPTKAGIYASNVKWHPNGALASYTLGNGITHTTTQNLRGLPETWADSGVAQDRYWYDQNGNPTYIQDQHQGVNNRSLGYDGLDRLITANGPWGSGQYTYDALDNIRASTVGGRSLSHNYDASNKLTSLTGSQYVNLGYDNNGNITQRGGQSFQFDIGNRLKSAPGKANYLYDAEGRRSWINYADGHVGGSAYSQAGQLLISGSSQHGTNWYIYLGGKQIAEHHHLGGTVDIKYIHTDALGSPVARTDANRTESHRTRYEPYGATHSGGVPAGLELGFTGHVNDGDTGLVQMQQRYYEPLAGRFLSVDPVTTNANTGAMFNRYDYAMNNPYKYVDPDGRTCTGSNIKMGCDGGGVVGHASGGVAGPLDSVSSKASSGTGGVTTAPAKPEHVSSLNKLTASAESATAKVDSNCTGTCRLPWVRGTNIHTAFADEVRKLGGNFSAEVSYKNGFVVPYGTPGSIRADAVHGDIAKPSFAVDLKTGLLGYMSVREAKAYIQNLPAGTDLYKLKVD
jgi:RHS repeat-associated protein